MLPQFRDIVRQLRQIMSEAAPEIAYSIPMWRRRRYLFAYLNPTKRDITFGFSRPPVRG